MTAFVHFQDPLTSKITCVEVPAPLTVEELCGRLSKLPAMNGGAACHAQAEGTPSAHLSGLCGGQFVSFLLECDASTKAPLPRTAALTHSDDRLMPGKHYVARRDRVKEGTTVTFSTTATVQEFSLSSFTASASPNAVYAAPPPMPAATPLAFNPPTQGASPQHAAACLFPAQRRNVAFTHNGSEYNASWGEINRMLGTDYVADAEATAAACLFSVS